MPIWKCSACIFRLLRLPGVAGLRAASRWPSLPRFIGGLVIPALRPHESLAFQSGLLSGIKRLIVSGNTSAQHENRCSAELLGAGLR